MRIDVLTLFPEVLEPFLASSIVGRAVKAGVVSIQCVDFRDFARDRHRSVDDKPFGGGPGMVLMCGPVFAAFARIKTAFTLSESASRSRTVVVATVFSPDTNTSPGTAL